MPTASRQQLNGKRITSTQYADRCSVAKRTRVAELGDGERVLLLAFGERGAVRLVRALERRLGGSQRDVLLGALARPATALRLWTPNTRVGRGIMELSVRTIFYICVIY